uniref:Uncharacterized protein n=1 Tax=Anguilla anguilla TaxID=7936 RepID=A0A0E9S3X2_ANGAN
MRKVLPITKTPNEQGYKYFASKRAVTSIELFDDGNGRTTSEKLLAGM